MGPISALWVPCTASILPTYMGAGKGGVGNIKMGTRAWLMRALFMGLRRLPKVLVGAVWHSITGIFAQHSGVHDPAAVMGDPQGGRGLIGGAHDPAPVMGGTQGDVQGGGGLIGGGGVSL